MSYPSYSIVIPAYNEVHRIPGTLEAVVACVRERGWSAEIIVVDDGSKDDTSLLALEYAKDKEDRMRVLTLARNRGKGGAVRRVPNSSVGMTTLLLCVCV